MTTPQLTSLAAPFDSEPITQLPERWSSFNQLEQFLFFLIKNKKLSTHDPNNLAVAFNDKDSTFVFSRDEGSHICFFDACIIEEDRTGLIDRLEIDIELGAIADFLAAYILPGIHSQHFLLKDIHKIPFADTVIERWTQELQNKFSKFEIPYFPEALIRAQKAQLEYNLSVQTSQNSLKNNSHTHNLGRNFKI